MNDKLKQCPFCGGKIVFAKNKNGLYCAQCSQCKCVIMFDLCDD